jgi:hypothetical protein
VPAIIQVVLQKTLIPICVQIKQRIVLVIFGYILLRHTLFRTQIEKAFSEPWLKIVLFGMLLLLLESLLRRSVMVGDVLAALRSEDVDFGQFVTELDVVRGQSLRISL